jgi:hypothetical protein
MAQMRKRMKFCGHCAVNMIQNISQGRADKAITGDDIVNISWSAGLSCYGGRAVSYQVTGIEGIVMALLYIKGTGLNKARILWVATHSCSGKPSDRWYSKYTSGTVHQWINAWSKFENLTIGADYDPNQMHEDLKIKEGEVKCALLLGIYCTQSAPRFWKFWILKPKPDYTAYSPSSSATQKIFLPVTVIFTPKPGLFGDTAPS